jgi:hypothetical protein
LQEAQSVFRLAKLSSDKNGIAGSRSAAEDGVAGTAFTNHRYVDKNVAMLRAVATGDGASKFSRRPTESGQELVQPPSGSIRWKCQTQQKTARFATHRGDVADRPSETFPADGLCWVQIGQKVPAFKEPIGCENCFKARTRPPDCGIIADPDGNGRSLRTGRARLQFALQPLHKRGFERDLAVFHDVEVQTDAQYSSAGATIPRCHAGNRRNPPKPVRQDS